MVKILYPKKTERTISEKKGLIDTDQNNFPVLYYFYKKQTEETHERINH